MSKADAHSAERSRLLTLTEREKETLRLLLRGHDAKSIAQSLGLSVHTVNERLRDARGKLGVSSSREAARLLAEAEQDQPNLLVYKPIGVAGDAEEGFLPEQADHRGRIAHRLAWLSGGMLIMSLVIAAAIVASVVHGGATAEAPELQTASPASAAAASLGAARDWMTLTDHQRWEESWRTAGTLFRSQISPAQWASTIQPVRQPLGTVSSRSFQSVTKSTSLPGAPAGEYEVLQFQTSFVQRKAAVETVILVRESAGWKVAGYFIR